MVDRWIGGALTADNTYDRYESLVVYYGPLSSTVDVSGTVDALLEAGESSHVDENIGTAILIKDIDNDGYDDIISQSSQGDYIQQLGGVFINYGPMSGTTDLSSSDAIIEAQVGDYAMADSVWPDSSFYDYVPAMFLGSTIATFPDIDGDGQEDLFIGGGNEQFWND